VKLGPAHDATPLLRSRLPRIGGEGAADHEDAGGFRNRGDHTPSIAARKALNYYAGSRSILYFRRSAVRFNMKDLHFL